MLLGSLMTEILENYLQQEHKSMHILYICDALMLHFHYFMSKVCN